MDDDRLAARFLASCGSPISVDGQEVRMSLTLSCDAGHVITITFEQVNPARPQAVRLKSTDGVVEVDSQRLADVVLWSDTAPALVVVRPVPNVRTGTMSLRLWNAWRDDAGTQQAWIGDAGMIVEETAEGYRARCGDGFDGATFDDLVVGIAVQRNA